MIAQPITKRTSGFPCLVSEFTTMKAPFGLSLLAAALLLGGAQQTFAATYSWVNGQTGNWSVTTSWSGSTPPVSSLDTEIALNINFASNTTANNDLAVGMQLNKFTASSGTAGGSKNVVITGNSLNFVKNSSNVLPTLLLSKGSNTGSGLSISIPFTVTDALTITSSGAQGGTILSGNINNIGGVTFTGGTTTASVTASGVISGAGGMAFNGAYTVTMSGANTYTGDTLVGAGTLSLTNASGLALQNSALDTSGAGVVTTTATTLTLGGLKGSTNLASVITTGYGAVTALTLNLSSGVTDTYSGIIANGAMTLTKKGLGTQVLSGGNTYTGLTTVSNGTLVLDAVNGGSLSSSSSLSLGSGGKFTINGAVNPAAPTAVVLTGITTTALTSAAISKNVLTLNDGVNLSASTLTSGGLTLVRGNRLGLDATGTAGSTNVTFSTTPTLVGSGSSGTSTVGVVANMIGDTSASGTGTGFVTYDASTGLRLLTAGEQTATVTAGSNVKITGATASAAVTVNSLELAAGGSITGANTITIGNNILLVSGANSGIASKIGTSNATSDFYIIANSDVTGADITSLGSANVLYKFGSGAASFTPVNLNGVVVVDEGTLALGGGTNKVRAITVNGGTFKYTANNIQIAASNLAVASVATVDFNGTTGASVVLSGSGTITNTAGTTGTMTVGSGTFSGNITSNLNLISSGALTLSGANTYTGTTNITGGTLTASGGSAIGNTSAVTLANVAATNLSLSGSETIGSLAGGGGTGGNVTLGANTLTTGGDNTSPAAYAGVISGTGGLTKIGTGTQTLSGANTYAGGTTITLGALSLANTSGLSATGFVTVNGGTLTSSVANVNLGVGAVSMSSGVIEVQGTGTAGTFTLAANQNFSTTGGTLNFDLLGSSSSNYDQIIGSGSGSFSLSGSTLALSGAFTSVAGTYQLFTGFGGSNSVSGLIITGLGSGLTGSLDTAGLLTIAAVPEPSTYVMLAGVLALGMGVWRRTRSRSV